jgi:hypothetical protein
VPEPVDDLRPGPVLDTMVGQLLPVVLLIVLVHQYQVSVDRLQRLVMLVRLPMIMDRLPVVQIELGRV